MLDVVVVSFRCAELLRRCLRSLQASPPARGLQVTVVDNASRDGTAEMVRREFPDVRLVELADNVGFAAANNLALRESAAEYVLVLNPDTAVGDRTLDVVLDVMDRNPRIGIAGCRLVQPDGTFDHAARRSFPTPLSALGHFLRIGRSDRAPAALTAYRAPQTAQGPVDAVNGAFMLIRRAMLDEIGLFDEGFWMYMEDLDLCRRAADSGWITWYEPTVSTMHAKAGTTGSHRTPRLNVAFHYGMYRYYRKHRAGTSPRLLNGLVYLGIGTKLAASVVRTEGRRRLHRARARGRDR